MTVPRAVNLALKSAGLCDRISTCRDLSGGCIHRVMEVELADGTRVVAKVNHANQLSLFEEEAAGLRALRKTRTVLVPQPIAVLADESDAVLVMDALESSRTESKSWIRFGEELAALHAAPAGNRYGFESNNHIGTTPQCNSWHDDWVEFNAVNRLGYQLLTARDAGLLTKSEAGCIDAVITRLDITLPSKPAPSLLHGDLWSGNALPTTDDSGQACIAIIDPACSIGDGLADIAMMMLFGGFPQVCFDAYFAETGDHENRNGRIAVYQLYHVLNHVNLFGRGYVAQAMSLAKSLGAD